MCVGIGGGLSASPGWGGAKTAGLCSSGKAPWWSGLGGTNVSNDLHKDERGGKCHTREEDIAARCAYSVVIIVGERKGSQNGLLYTFVYLDGGRWAMTVLRFLPEVACSPWLGLGAW